MDVITVVGRVMSVTQRASRVYEARDGSGQLVELTLGPQICSCDVVEVNSGITIINLPCAGLELGAKRQFVEISIRVIPLKGV